MRSPGSLIGCWFRLPELHQSFHKLKHRPWLWPILAMAVFLVAGTVIQYRVQFTLEENARTQLQSKLDVQAAMLKDWISHERLRAEELLQHPDLNDAIFGELLQSAELRTTRIPSDEQRSIKDAVTVAGYAGYLIAGTNRDIVSSSSVELIGQLLHPTHASAFDDVLQGRTIIIPPSTDGLVDSESMFAGGPQRSQIVVCTALRRSELPDAGVTGFLGLLIEPERDFARILELGRSGASGDTYAFNREGLMLSRSRFDEELMLLGLLPENEAATTFLYLHVRDPGHDVRLHGRPRVRLQHRPLTRPAESALRQESGVTTRPYRDYRGAAVVGAWTWIPEMGIGVTAEMEADEAFAAAGIVRRALFLLQALLACSALGILIGLRAAEYRRCRRRQASGPVVELGPYRLETQLGAGAMGVVYKASHTLMQRISAVKLLNVNQRDDAAAERFEHEVRTACQLTHPNTISIYDYGRTAEGTFYYAMEYLDGIDLQQLVEKYGPQPEGRVIHILKQVCGALYEAHALGLVHRDIKPSNIMINLRGGDADVVKVLDFGLVKAIKASSDSSDSGTSVPDSINGTALYLSPEAIQSPSTVDARSDLYALGAVGYFLLTGQPVFTAASLASLLQKHLSAAPLPPSVCLGKPVSEQLETTLIACLSKSPEGRPESARTLSDLLSQVPTAQAWTRDEADRWWSRVQRGLSPTKPRIGRSVTCKFEQTMVNIEEVLNWADSSSQDESDSSALLADADRKW